MEKDQKNSLIEEILGNIKEKVYSILDFDKYEDSTAKVKEDKENKDKKSELAESRYKYELCWNKLEKAYSDKEKSKNSLVVGKVVNITPSGLKIMIDDTLTGLVPKHMLWYRLSSYHIGEELKLTVKRLKRTPQLILLSEKAAHKVINEAKKKELFERLDVGSKVEGKVWRIYDSGVLLDLDSTLGFIPKEELFQDNKFRIHRGQKLEALVTKIDKKTYKITLSLKRLDEAELWEKIKFYPGEIKEGVIVRIKKNIYFIRLPCGIEGVAYEEDIKKEGVVTKELKENDKVKIRILNFSKEKKRLKLTILPEFTPSSPQKITLGDIFKEKLSRIVS